MFKNTEKKNNNNQGKHSKVQSSAEIDNISILNLKYA